ncbi:arylsulfatase [Brevibacillus nitrificans]|uniref:arylsulfatase n=1 Tax=Brevibacillus nitrificans TaxID=651560 RepID=UPI00263463FD|nr:arylsulfatase [Brevibacillus nitrificans]
MGFNIQETWPALRKMTTLGSVLALAGTMTSLPNLTAMAAADVTPIPSAQAAKAPKPNVVYIVIDDSGFSDLGSYGSEIKTPNIDQLAANGLRYNNFNVSPLCSPTRASLLTGRNSHSVGMGSVANLDFGPAFPNRQGSITPAAATAAEILKDDGYSTFALGKWHLAPTFESTPAGPFDNWPLGKGFERFYGYVEDSTDQYRPELTYDNHAIETPKKKDYHLSEDLVDHAEQFITDQVSVAPDKPFYLYLSFGAQHMPHQVPQEYIDKYKGVYDKGWDKIREERYARQKQMGIIPANAELAPRNPGVPAWDSLTADEKKVYTRFQETYAGFLTHTDEQVGRFIDLLKSTGELDHTMIVLLSDNGASAIAGNTGTINHTLAYNFIPENPKNILARMDEIGTERAGSDYPAGWAQVSNTPFKEYKNSTYAGGTRTPLIISWPEGIKDKGAIRTQYTHVIDVTPTVLDVLDLDAPKTYKGIKQMPMHGTSIAYTFTDAKAPSKRKTQIFEVRGNRAIYDDGWRAVTMHKKGEPFEKDKWELYNVKEDFSEIRNVADKYPEKLRELQELWMKEAEKYDVLPQTDIFIEALATVNTPDSPRARNTFTYYPGMAHLSDSASPPVMNRSYTITVPIDRSSKTDEGVIVALGNHESGYTLYIKDNRLVYEYNAATAVYKIQSSVEVPTGKSTLRFEFQKTGPYAGTGILSINDKKVGEGSIAKTIPYKISFEGMDIGRDTLYPVSANYSDKDEFPFTGKIEKVVFDLKNDVKDK